MPEPDFTIRQGDTVPAIFGSLKDENGHPRLLVAGETASFVLWPLGGSADDALELPARSAAGSADVSYQWRPDDTGTPGVYAASWRVESGPDEEHNISMVKGEDSSGTSGQLLILIPGEQTPFYFTILQGESSLGTFRFDEDVFVTEFGDDGVPHELDGLTGLVPPLANDPPNPFMTEIGGPIFVYGLDWENPDLRPDNLSVIAGSPKGTRETFPNDGYLTVEIQPAQPVSSHPLFATSNDLEKRLGIRFSSDEHLRAVHLLSNASGLIRSETGQTVSLLTDDVLIRPGVSSARLRLPQRPVAAVSEVKIDDVVIDPASYYVDEDELVRGRHERFDRQFGGGWGREWNTLTIKYTHGSDPVPEVIKTVCLEAVARVWTNPGTVVSEQYGPEIVQYQAANGLLLTRDERTAVRKAVARMAGSLQLR